MDRAPFRGPRAAALSALLAAAACGPPTDVAVPVVSTLSRPPGGGVARPLNLCDAQIPVDPTSALKSSSRLVNVRGSGFLPQVRDVTDDHPQVVLPEVLLRGPIAIRIDPLRVGYVDSTNLQVLVPLGPTGLPEGLYDVVVTDPEGTSAALGGGLRIIPPPFIQAVAPSSICNTQDQHVVVTGGVFSAESPPTVTLNGGQLPSGDVRVDSPTQLTLTVPAGSLGPATAASIGLLDADTCTLQQRPGDPANPSVTVGTQCAP